MGSAGSDASEIRGAEPRCALSVLSAFRMSTIEACSNESHQITSSSPRLERVMEVADSPREVCTGSSKVLDVLVSDLMFSTR